MTTKGTTRLVSDSNIIYADESLRSRALELASGSYQYGLLTGSKRWSGSDVPSKYSASYSKSRHTLLTRLNDAGIPAKKIKVDGGRVVLLVGNVE